MHVSQHNFFRFFSVSASENGARIHVFFFFSRNRRFCKNPRKHWLCAQKSRFDLEKNKKKTFKNRLPNVLVKNTTENLSKFDFYSHLGLPKPPKISPKCAKNEKKSPSKKTRKKKLWKSTGLTANQAFWEPAGPSNHLSND